MTKVEPSDDDTLTEILTSFYASVTPDIGVEERDLAEARTQLLQYIEGEVIGRDTSTEGIEQTGDNIDLFKVIAVENRLKAEQRQRLHRE